MSRDDRFKNLEQPRRAPQDSAPRVAAERFAPPPERAEPGPPAPPGVEERVAPNRFDADGAGLALERRGERAPNFLRCCACAADSSVGAARCQHCGADLHTPEQQAFNAALWEQLQAEREAGAQEDQRRALERDTQVAQEQRLAPLRAQELAQPYWATLGDIALEALLDGIDARSTARFVFSRVVWPLAFLAAIAGRPFSLWRALAIAAAVLWPLIPVRVSPK
jgi:hypothetical protein